MLPNFLCIGSQKAGTTWLYENLKQNPDVWLPLIKEIHYFDYYYGDDTGSKNWAPGHIKNAMARLNKLVSDGKLSKEYYEGIKKNEPFSLEWYQSIYNHEDTLDSKIRGDITPEYSSMKEEGIVKLKETIVNPKIIWIIRDPLQRAISQVKMVISRQSLAEPKTDSEWENAFSKVRYKNRANYKKHIPLWDKYFAESELLYLPYGDIKSRPSELIREIEDFLEISTCHYTGIDQIVHKTKSLDLPQWIIEEISKNIEPQYSYLEERFEKDFLNRIK